MKYPKLQTLWKRDEKGKIIEGEYSKEEFESINRWTVCEKVDGTNVRIMLRDDKITFGGREDNSQMPVKLVNYLMETFPIEKLRHVFPEGDFTLFGEGYGAKIQRGGGSYRADASFILFDVVSHDMIRLLSTHMTRNWWLTRASIEDIAANLKIKAVPVLPLLKKDDIVRYVVNLHNSVVAEQPVTMEGIVATSYPLMHFRNGDPIKFKLKCRDFR